MDGLGIGKDYVGNAVLRAKTPTLDRLWSRSPVKALLGACGPDVGLPQGVPGNSEVGHLNLGSGAVVYQMISTINDSIVDGSFFENGTLVRVIQNTKAKGKRVHIVGLLSASGVHADIRHLFALLELCSKLGVDPFIHVITDGRDTPRYEAKFYYQKLLEKCKKFKIGRVASISGRFWAMDRNNKWDRIKKAYSAMIGADAIREKDFDTAVDNAYKRGEDDETLTPTVLTDILGTPIGSIGPEDTIIFYNFREDRARQLTKAFVLPDMSFPFFVRPFITKSFVTMSGYEQGLPVEVLFHPQESYTNLSDIVAAAGYKQYHIAETEKFPHVTYFFNGGREQEAVGETYATFESPNVFDYSETPQMSGYKITRQLVARILANEEQLYIVNFANPDMVGHSGKLQQAIEAVEVTDRCVFFVLQALFKVGGRAIIVADHGNCDIMINPISGEPDKNHTLNLVPFIYADSADLLNDNKWQNNLTLERLSFDSLKMNKTGILADVAPSLLTLLDLKPSDTMVGQSLLTSI